MPLTKTLKILESKLSLWIEKGDNVYSARCPAHEDVQASLSIVRDNDKILLKCFAGCTFKEIVTALKMEEKDFFLPKEKSKSKIVAEYDYTDESGKLIYQIVRFDPKSFRPRHKDKSGKWIYDLKGVKRYLYRLPELMEAVGIGKTVFIVGGEKDVNNAFKIGLVATTNTFGESNWKDEYNPYFIDADVVIIPDDDYTGYNHANHIFENLQPLANSVKILILPKLKGKSDLSDFIEINKDKSYEMLMDLMQTNCFAYQVENPHPKPILKNKNGSKNNTVEEIQESVDLGKIWDKIYDPVVKGNATIDILRHKLVIDALKDKYKICASTRNNRKVFFHYHEGYWQEITENEIAVLFSHWLKIDDCTQRTIDAVVGLIPKLQGFFLPYSKFNNQPWLINLENGTYNLQTYELQPHSPDDYLTYKNDYIFDKNAKCTFFEKELLNYSMNDPHWIKVLWEITGYCLLGVFPFQKMFWFTGSSGRNGKGTIIRVIEHLIGEALSLPGFNLKSLQDRFFKTAIQGKRLVTTGDMSPHLSNVPGLKQLTGGDRQYTDVKFLDYNVFTSVAKYIFAMNNLPSIPETENLDPIIKRILILNFDFKIVKENSTIEDKFFSELPGIFNKAIEGLKRLLTNNEFSKCERSQRALDGFAGRGNMIASFMSDKIKEDKKGFIFYFELYESYFNYMNDHCGKDWDKKPYYISDQQTLKKRVIEYYKSIESGKRHTSIRVGCNKEGSYYGFCGIKLKDQMDVLFEDMDDYFNKMLHSHYISENTLMTLKNIIDNLTNEPEFKKGKELRVQTFKEWYKWMDDIEIAYKDKTGYKNYDLWQKFIEEIKEIIEQPEKNWKQGLF